MKCVPASSSSTSGRISPGWAQLRVSGPAGTEVTLRYAEKLDDDGDIDQSNINVFIKSGDCQTDRYILKGDGVEVWEPRFTYHGFQYVQVTGFPGTPALDSLRGRVVRSAFPSAGDFACSNATAQRHSALHALVLRRQFRRHPHRLPASRKERLDGRCANRRGNGLVQLRGGARL